MAHKKGFEIDRRVAIAMDALSASQRAGLNRVLHDRAHFVTYASAAGRTQKLSPTQPLYKTKVGSTGLRLIFSKVDDNIAVLDLVHKTTMDRFGTKKKRRSVAPKKGRKPPSTVEQA
jgi:hypothetical protein